MKRTLLLLLALVVVTGMLAGCEKKFTQKRFDTMIINGQSKMEVEKILGKPDARWDTSWKWVDFDKGASGKVVFDENGKVIGKKWSDANRDDADPETKWRKGERPPSSKGGDAGAGKTGGSSESTEMMVTP